MFTYIVYDEYRSLVPVLKSCCSNMNAGADCSYSIRPFTSDIPEHWSSLEKCSYDVKRRLNRRRFSEILLDGYKNRGGLFIQSFTSDIPEHWSSLQKCSYCVNDLTVEHLVKSCWRVIKAEAVCSSNPSHRVGFS